MTISVLQPFDRWAVESVDDGCSTAVVTSTGIISLMIHKSIRVDLTVDGAIRILNFAVRFDRRVLGERNKERVWSATSTQKPFRLQFDQETKFIRLEYYILAVLF